MQPDVTTQTHGQEVHYFDDGDPRESDEQPQESSAVRQELRRPVKFVSFGRHELRVFVVHYQHGVETSVETRARARQAPAVSKTQAVLCRDLKRCSEVAQKFCEKREPMSRNQFPGISST